MDISIPVVAGTQLRQPYTLPIGLTELSDDAQLDDGCGMFRILNQVDGDKRVVWNRMNLPEIRSAKQMFNDLIAEGLVPYRVGPGGARSNSVMREFDATAEEVIFIPVPLAVGG